MIRRLVSVFLAVSVSGLSSEHFHEELFLQPLPNADLLAHFNFVTLSPLSKSRQHLDLMPRLIGEFIDTHGLDELDVALSRGVWRPKHWGLPPRTTAAGAKVSAVFSNRVTDVDAAWDRLTNALAGQFCASLNFLDSTQSISPKWSFRPSGIIGADESASNASSRTKVGMLPGENVCTENLTPWKKLLPCGAKRGLATLLNAGHIHATKFHGLGLSLRLICPEHASQCTDPLIEVSQYVVLVFDPVTLPDNIRASQMERENYWSNWSIRTLFGIGVSSACPLATTSTIFIDSSSDQFEILPPGQSTTVRTSAGHSAESFDVRKLVTNGVHNLNVKYDKPVVYGLIPAPRIHATRYIVGHGADKGGIVTKVTNEGPEPLTIVYLDIIPWYLRVYLHTLKLSVNGAGVDVDNGRLAYTPGVDRKRPYSIELAVDIPARSRLEISVEFEKSILKWLEYPPDANKGFYVNSAVVSAVVGAQENVDNFTGIPRHASTFGSESGGPVATLVTLYTESLLVILPTPDFSMPYNVICLACTVIALAFGPLNNITTKKLTIVEKPADSLPTKALGYVKSLFKKSADDSAKKND